MKTTLLTALLFISVTSSALAAGEYEYLQWGRKNTGEGIELKLTDIDRMKLAVNKGEDINLGDLKEVPGRKIRVAIIDSGVDLTHPDLSSRIYRNDGECKAWEQYQLCLNQNKEDDEKTQSCHNTWAKTDTDQNGYPMDCHGWNVAAPVNPFNGVQGNNDVMDYVGHGTHISGIIGALQDDLGISGVINNVEILPVKVSGSTEEVHEDNTTDIFAKGILYALKQNVDIINLSVGWSSKEDSLIVSELIKKAHEMGVLVVVAGGNSAHSTETYPCAYNEVICVGSHNPDGTRSHFSNFGSSIDIYAPGHNILSTWPLELRPKLFTVRHGFEFKNGTSFSSPYVVGVLARLLNLGYSPAEARVKLLASARNAKNTDFMQAVNFKPKSFIYPFKKSAAFINWHEGERKIILKLKNYLQTAKNVTLMLHSPFNSVKIKQDSKTFDVWAENEIKEVTFLVEGGEHIPSEMNLELRITTQDENKAYTVQAVAATVIHDRFARPDAKRASVQTNRSLEGFEFSPIVNIHPGKTTDFLISRVINGKLAVGVLKFLEGSYKLSRLHNTIFDKARLIQVAKVDLNLDGKPEYVMTGMYQNKEKKWTARFYIFDENFRQSELEICPGNELVNLITSMGTELRWIKKNNRMVPAWISMGYAPTLDLPKFDPWVGRVENALKKRIYYLDEQGLRSLNMPSVLWSDFSPVVLFNQNKDDLKEGKVSFIYTLDQSYKKNYALSDTDKLNTSENLVFGRYQNIYPLEATGQVNTQELVFSEIDSTTGRGHLSVISAETKEVLQQDFEYANLLDPIQFVLNRTTKGNYFAHTKYSLLYMDGEKVFKTESRNADQLIQYKRLKTKEGLYLSSQHTPGLSSELVEYQDGQIIRPAKYRFLVGNGCQEIGYNYSLWEEQDQIIFYCDNSKSIINISL